VFWDATPDDKKKFVADPSQGSRHNRGCAVDISLYDLKTGKPIEMVSTYDETTDRAYPDYPVVLRCNVGTATFYVTQCSRRALPCIRRNGGTLITKIGSDTESAL